MLKMTNAITVVAPNNNEDEDANLQYTINVTDVNSYNVRYCDYCSNKSSISGSSYNENQTENAQKIVIVLQERLIEEWLNVASMLAQRGIRLIIPEIIGFGYSDKPAANYNIDFFIDFLVTFLEKLKITDREKRSITILGYSLGGQLAAELAIRFASKKPSIEKLILVAPTGTMTNSNPALVRYIMAMHDDCFSIYPGFADIHLTHELFSYYMIYNPNVVVIPEELIRNYSNALKLPNARYASISAILEFGLAQRVKDGKLTPKLKGRLSYINFPTLVIWGYNDKIVPVENSKGFMDEIPNCKLLVIRDCGHIPHIEKPIEFSKIILDFLL